MGFDYFQLAYCTPDVLEKIRVAEAEGRFNDHLDPIEADGILPVDENFPYKPGFFLNLVYFFRRVFFLNGFTKRLNRTVLHTSVTGRENLKGVRGAVYVCNHVNKYDALAVVYALKFRPLKIMVAEFNNRPGFLGDMMRAAGILPLKFTRECIKKFGDAVRYFLSRGTGVLFFPEGSEWWCYKKPRPMIDGAFHYAVQNDVPVVPLFITFSDSCGTDALLLPDFTVNILEPIYPADVQASNRKELSRALKEKAEQSWRACYERVYGERL